MECGLTSRFYAAVSQLGATAVGEINAMRAHSSPIRAYLLDAMVYDVMYARFPVARAK